MNEEIRKEYTDRMTSELPILRKVLRMTQGQLAEKLGLSRSTVANIESGRQKMTWNVFLSIITIVRMNPQASKLLTAMELYDSRLKDFLAGKEEA